MQRVAALARHAGGLNVVPYMGTGGVWRLAATVAAHSGVTVRVAAPPPRLTKRVNDKLWFAQRVVEVLGTRAIPTTSSVFGPAALTGRVAALAKHNRHVAIKVPDSAGAAGNLVLDSTSLRGLSARALQERLLTVLWRLEWDQAYPLLVTVWDRPVVASPSVQLWIPESGRGFPFVEGVFDQNVQEPAGEFIGAMPTTLPEQWCLRLADEAARLGFLFQALGYFGRCSFDATLVGEDVNSAVLHWIECNGRWGATSILMTLANRLGGDWRMRPFITVHRRRYPAGPGLAVASRTGPLSLCRQALGSPIG